jgi:ubiquinone/menaquinone biosynthesis C-methylase UbiE
VGIEQIPWLYDALMALNERGLRRWRARLGAEARGQVLELGCGTGRNLEALPAGCRAVAIDPWLPSLRRAAARAPHVRLVCARAEALPFKDGAFDTALSALVFCSVARPDDGLAEVRRVLAPGGALRMLEHVRSRHRLWARLQDAVQPAWTWLNGGCHPNRDTEAAVARAGFRLDAAASRARGTLRLIVGVRRAP